VGGYVNLFLTLCADAIATLTTENPIVSGGFICYILCFDAKRRKGNKHGQIQKFSPNSHSKRHRISLKRLHNGA
jgi:hypothetical protein